MLTPNTGSGVESACGKNQGENNSPPKTGEEAVRSRCMGAEQAWGGGREVSIRQACVDLDKDLGFYAKVY